MPNYHRIRIEGGTYFFTVVTAHRRPILTTEPARSILHDVWTAAKQLAPFETLAICLLPDHIHCIWRLPDGDANYSAQWNMIKGFFSKRYLNEEGLKQELSPSQVKRREAGIWQRRFWEHAICDEDDLDAHLDYIHYNPVKHGYVEKAIDWKWSSLHRYVQKGFYDGDWVGGDEGKFEMLAMG